MTKRQLAEVIGQKLKEISFGKVSITGIDYTGDYYKGMLESESVEIQVEPNARMENGEFYHREGSIGNKEYWLKRRERDRVELNKEL